MDDCKIYQPCSQGDKRLMADIISPELRSANMAAIHSKNTKPEIYLRKLLFAEGYRYRINEKSIPGHPDIFLRKYNTAIFIHGCFWHRHENCKFAYFPKSNIEFWKNKFNKNIERDIFVKSELGKIHIKCLIIWECTIKKMLHNDILQHEIITEIKFFLNNSSMLLEL